MPDLDLVTTGGPLRLFTLLPDARPALLNLGEAGGVDITPVAWVGDDTDQGLPDALTTWFGPPTAG